MEKESVLLNQYQIKVISCEEEFITLENDWNILLKQLHNTNLFLSFEWMLTWWKCLGFGKNLLIYVIKNGIETIGIVPLMIDRRSIARFNYYEIRFISTIPIAYSPNSFSGSLDILINPDHVNSLEVFFRFLLTETKGWNSIRLHPLPENSETIRILTKLGQDLNIKVKTKKIFDNAYLQIKNSWETYFNERSNKFRKNLMRAEKNLAENRKVTFVEYRSPDDINEALNNIQLVESRAWKEEKGVKFDDEQNHHFILNLPKSFLKMDG